MSSSREMKKYLFDALEAGKSIVDFTREHDFDAFSNNPMLQAAVERKFEIIGEALSRIGRRDIDILSGISEHKKIISFRNIIAHGYDVIDQELIWDAVTNHLPGLLRELETLLED